jgi:hypothetical protein
VVALARDDARSPGFTLDVVLEAKIRLALAHSGEEPAEALVVERDIRTIVTRGVFVLRGVDTLSSLPLALSGMPTVVVGAALDPRDFAEVSRAYEIVWTRAVARTTKLMQCCIVEVVLTTVFSIILNDHVAFTFGHKSSRYLVAFTIFVIPTHPLALVQQGGWLAELCDGDARRRTLAIKRFVHTVAILLRVILAHH